MKERKVIYSGSIVNSSGDCDVLLYKGESEVDARPMFDIELVKRFKNAKGIVVTANYDAVVDSDRLADMLIEYLTDFFDV